MTDRGPAGAPGHGAPRHETRDVDVRAAAWAGAALLLGSALAALGMKLLFDVLAAREARRQPEVSPLAAALAPQQPPEPRLQASSARDLLEMRAAEERELTTYGWIDEAAGVVRIPIERAMDLVAMEGLPAAAGRPAAGEAGARAPEAEP